MNKIEMKFLNLNFNSLLVNMKIKYFSQSVSAYIPSCNVRFVMMFQRILPRVFYILFYLRMSVFYCHVFLFYVLSQTDLCFAQAIFYDSNLLNATGFAKKIKRTGNFNMNNFIFWYNYFPKFKLICLVYRSLSTKNSKSVYWII